MPVSRRDKEVAVCVKNLEKEKRIEKRQQILTKIRILLHERMQDKSVSGPLEVALGPPVVDCIRQAPANEKILEESSCILYFVSKLDPQFKKGVARLFKAMEDHKENLAIQRASCGAIRNVVAANPDSLPRIAPSVSTILSSMDRHSNDVKFTATALEVLANLAAHAPSKDFFVSSGALEHVLVAMKQNYTQASVQASAFRALANLSQEANPELKAKMTPCLRLMLRGMNQHASIHPKVATYGCCTIRNLSQMQEAAQAGAISSIVKVMKNNIGTPMVQEQGCAALNNLLINCPLGDVNSMTNDGGVSVILEALGRHPKSPNIQKDGLGVLSVLTNRAPANHEVILSEGGLDVIVSAMTAYEDDIDVSQIGCEFLKNFTRQSLDLQRAVTAKGGILVVLTAMRKHIQMIDVQDSAFACMRNLCTHRDNRVQVKLDGGISTMLVTMNVFAQDAAIQAYGCDALGRLAFEPDNRAAIHQENGIDVALGAIEGHAKHAGVQDRACFMLLALTDHEEALAAMKEKDIIPMLKNSKVPPKKDAVERLQKLVARVDGSGQGWFKGMLST